MAVADGEILRLPPLLDLLKQVGDRPVSVGPQLIGGAVDQLVRRKFKPIGGGPVGVDRPVFLVQPRIPSSRSSTISA